MGTSGETFILTSDGQIKMKDVVNKHVRIWNGREWSTLKIEKIAENQRIIRVHLTGELYLDCKPTHLFPIAVSTNNNSKRYIIKSAIDLTCDDKIYGMDLPVIRKYMVDEFRYPYSHGLFCADGNYENSYKDEHPCGFNALDNTSYCKHHQGFSKPGDLPSEKCQGISGKKQAIIRLYGVKEELLNNLDVRIDPIRGNGNNVLYARLPVDILPKFTVPVNASLTDKLLWFAGYCDGDGYVDSEFGRSRIRVSSINLGFLKNIHLMLQTLGVDSKILLVRDEGNELIITGGREYNAHQNTLYRLSISSDSVSKLINLGFSPKRLKIQNLPPKKSRVHLMKVLRVQYLDELSNIYGCRELLRGMVVLNGILSSDGMH